MSIVYATGAYVLTDFDSQPTPPPPPLPIDNTPEELDPVFTEIGPPAVIEYGYNNSIIHNSDPLHVYIRYPQAGNPTDGVIKEWAQEFFDGMALNYYTEVPVGPTDFGEINIQFNSYLIDNRYAGIHQFGEYSYHTTGQELEIIKTFNIDLTRFELLEPSDILDIAEPEAVLSLLSLRLLVEHPKTDGYHIYMDESWLSYLLITHEGIKVFLPHNEFLPDSFPSLTVLLPYEDLGASLLIRQGAPLPSMPIPTPEVTPTPEPTPTPTPDPDGDPDGNTDGDPDGDPDGNTDGNADGNADGDPDGNTDGDPDGNADGDPDGNADGDLDGDTDGDTDGDPDGGEEEPPPEAPKQSGPIDPNKPTIALSFDDGPGNHTDEILDLLEQYGVRATFFTVGNLVHTQGETLRRAVEMGCEVAGHSWNHKNLAKMNADDVRIQLEATQAAIEAAVGVTVPIFRPPYSAISDTMKGVSEELELSMITWNVYAEDWKHDDPEAIYELIMEQVSDKAIIISHELYESTREAYQRIIPELLIQGYQIVTVSELLGQAYRELNYGQTYYSGHKVEVLT